MFFNCFTSWYRSIFVSLILLSDSKSCTHWEISGLLKTRTFCTTRTTRMSDQHPGFVNLLAPSLKSFQHYSVIRLTRRPVFWLSKPVLTMSLQVTGTVFTWKSGKRHILPPKNATAQSDTKQINSLLNNHTLPIFKTTVTATSCF